MGQVRAKKKFGQHFLKDQAVAARIVSALTLHGGYKQVLEIGPGMGVLSGLLFQRKEFKTYLIEIDKESIVFLNKEYPEFRDQIIEGDFLQMDLRSFFKSSFAIIGNFPYNISTQILFRVLDNRILVPEVVGMFQKEVAERIASPPGNREYGILSVFMQAYYQVDLLFMLNEHDFDPPPKVKSAVLHFIRKENFSLGCDELKFRKVVKAGFNQRRKTLRNALAALTGKEALKNLPYLDLRAEALSWEQFVEITNLLNSPIGNPDDQRHN